MIQICFMDNRGIWMKLKKVVAAIGTVLGSQILMPNALADRIIQRPTGAFYIVSNKEASDTYDRNTSGLFRLPPSSNTHFILPAAVSSKTKSNSARQKPSVKHTKSRKPVTTVEPAESIYLRLEKKNK